MLYAIKPATLVSRVERRVSTTSQPVARGSTQLRRPPATARIYPSPKLFPSNPDRRRQPASLDQYPNCPCTHSEIVYDIVLSNLLVQGSPQGSFSPQCPAGWAHPNFPFRPRSTSRIPRPSKPKCGRLPVPISSRSNRANCREDCLHGRAPDGRR